jgi:hypothetical protein
LSSSSSSGSGSSLEEEEEEGNFGGHQDEEESKIPMPLMSVPTLRHIKDHYPVFSFDDLANHPAIVNLPYQVSVMSYFEYYRMNLPMLFPTIDLAMRLGLDERVYWRHIPEPPTRGGRGGGGGGGEQRRGDPNDESDPDNVADWLSLADFYRWPHVLYFDTAEELADLLLDTDFLAVSKAMQRENALVEVEVRDKWRSALNDAFTASFEGGDPQAVVLEEDFDAALGGERWRSAPLPADVPHALGCDAMGGA